MGTVTLLRSLFNRQTRRAVITPLASILGSGLLIILPVLEQTLGAWALFGALAVCGVAWVTGTAIRHNVAVVEPLAAAGKLDSTTKRLEWLADAVIVVAYVISVALYLRIMAEYVVSYATANGSLAAEKILACAAVVVIVVIGVTRGFAGLDKLDRVTVGVVLILTTVLGVTIVIHDIGLVRTGEVRLPPVPEINLGPSLLILGGIVITVQGFETIRYLGEEFDAETRIWASRLAQLISSSIYFGIIFFATPVMGLGTPAGADKTLLDIVGRIAPWVALPLVVSAVLSQFSAAIADTAAAEGNLHRLSHWMRGPRPFLISGAAAIVLAATVSTAAIIAVASRAFAAYYVLQAVIALRTSAKLPEKVGYGVLAAVMLAVTIFAQPAG